MVPRRKTTSGDLTPRQRAILDHIQRTHARRGYPPSVREIGEAVGLASPSSVHAQLSSLVEKGYLRKDATRPRAIAITNDAARRSGVGDPADVARVPLVGQIAAGSPILAEQNIEDSIAMPAGFVGSGTLFALSVRGDSMIDAGIFDGDTVIVRQQPSAENGQIVAALVDGEEATVKYLRRARGTVSLEPANDAYEPIQADNIAILGKVVSVLRRL